MWLGGGFTLLDGWHHALFISQPFIVHPQLFRWWEMYSLFKGVPRWHEQVSWWVYDKYTLWVKACIGPLGGKDISEHALIFNNMLGFVLSALHALTNPPNFINRVTTENRSSKVCGPPMSASWMLPGPCNLAEVVAQICLGQSLHSQLEQPWGKR